MGNIYVSKVTAAGQVSLPKALRKEMGIGEDYVIIEPFGDVILVRKIQSTRDEIFAYFERTAKAKGITREKLDAALKRAGPRLLKEIYELEP
jgi:AbrB family looped-hinge helix DNA binding protein